MKTLPRRAQCIKMLVDSGFADKLFLSTEGMLFGVRRLLPRLSELGVSSEQIHVMTVENPKAFFRRRTGT